jgi:hypothetical protein
VLGLPALGDTGGESLLTAEEVLGGHAAVLEDDLAGVRRATAELVELAQHPQAGRSLRHDEYTLTAVAGVGVDGGDDDMYVGDPAVADEHLLAVDDPVAGILARPGLDRPHVAASARLRDGQSGELDGVGRAEALPRPVHQLLVGGGLPDRRERQGGHDDRQADPCAAPEQLLHEDRQRQASRIDRQLGIELPLVEPLVRGPLRDWPRQLLCAVVLRRRWADHVAGERVRLGAQRLLLVGELEREAHSWSAKLRRATGSSRRTCSGNSSRAPGSSSTR